VSGPESISARASYHGVHLTAQPGRRIVWQIVAEYLAPWVARDAHVLELGAGYCDWINAVQAARKVAVDLWSDFGRHANEDVKAIVLDVAGGLSLLGAEQFDVVMASNLLEHFEANAASSIVSDVSAVLKPGGRFIVIQPNFRFAYRRYFDDYTHRSIFTDTSLANLLRSHHFTIELSRSRFLPYSIREVRRPIPAWLIRAYLRSPIKPMAGQMLIIGRKG
jgi:SAM-dependent methyltransferase